MALTLFGLLKRQLPPPWSRNWMYSSTLQRENFLGRYVLYPVSSMMQPSQASGHLQSPVKKTPRKKSTDLGTKTKTTISLPLCVVNSECNLGSTITFALKILDRGFANVSLGSPQPTRHLLLTHLVITVTSSAFPLTVIYTVWTHKRSRAAGT
ncbi:hypothetical protein EYF80_003821 [Liparis tanakae]|uniref:Uncharacterized protein n=1 Tax=Liparis tanakae TaxID=230148 RepID=A0A4Z2J7H6_9TELE|nr:hypothetical protein EYF80_003821 [Liparis tanakae]